MSQKDPITLGIDVAKIAHFDGLGSYARGLVRGIDEVLQDQDRPLGRILLVDLLGGLDDDALRAEVGALSDRFESRLGRTEEALAEIDTLISPNWVVPPGFDGKLLFVVHDLTFLSHPDCHTIDNRIHCLEGCLRAIAHDASFVAVSQATADELEQRLDIGPDRCHVVHQGIDPRFRKLDHDEVTIRLKARFGLQAGYVLAVGSLEPRKNLERLVEAHRALPDTLRAAHRLVVVGAGGWRNEMLAATLQDAEARGDVHRLGRVDHDDLATLYNGAHLFAFPSLAEGFGLPVVEAMACGTPVLTSDRSALPEAAGGAAHLVDPTNTEAIRAGLETILGDEAERRRLAVAGVERAEEVSWRAGADSILRLGA